MSRDKTAERPVAYSDDDYQAAQGHSRLSQLYTGTGAFEIVAHRRRWFAVTAAILLICVLSMGLRGFNWGIDFEGGTLLSIKSTSATSNEAVREAFSAGVGFEPESVQTVGSGGSATVQIRAQHLDQTQTDTVTKSLASRFSIPTDEVSSSDVSSTWGDEITNKALVALAVFLVLVLIYITIRFDREMAVASLAALIFDLVVTAGVYSLVGFEVSPASVIGLLTILGFSLYDTVVVFDKVEENTRGYLHTTRRTYAEQANLAVNQTLMRSINTAVISILPVISLMVVAAWLLGVGTLQDLGLIQLVGILVGIFSSVFLATPLLVVLKNLRKDTKRHNAKVAARRAGLDPRTIDEAKDTEPAPRPQAKARTKTTPAGSEVSAATSSPRAATGKSAAQTPTGKTETGKSPTSKTQRGGRPQRKSR